MESFAVFAQLFIESVSQFAVLTKRIGKGLLEFPFFTNHLRGATGGLLHANQPALLS